MCADCDPVSPKTIPAAHFQVVRPDSDNLGATTNKSRSAPVIKLNVARTDSDKIGTTINKPKIKLVLTPKVAPANRDNMGATKSEARLISNDSDNMVATKYMSEVKLIPESEYMGTENIARLSFHDKVSHFQSLYQKEQERAREPQQVRDTREARLWKIREAEIREAESREARPLERHSRVPILRQDTDNKSGLPIHQPNPSISANEPLRRTAAFSIPRQDDVIKTSSKIYKKPVEARAAPAAHYEAAHGECAEVAPSTHAEIIRAKAIRPTAIHPIAGQLKGIIPETDPGLTPEQIQAERARTEAFIAEIVRVRALRARENKNRPKAPEAPDITAQAVPYIIDSPTEGCDRIEAPKVDAEDASLELQAARCIHDKETPEERVSCKERDGYKVSRAAKETYNQQRTRDRVQNSLKTQVLENAVDLSLIVESDQVIDQNREVGVPVVQKDWGTYQGAVAASGEIVLGAITSGFGAGVVVKKVADTILDNKIENRLRKSRKKRELEQEPEIVDLPKYEELVCGEEWVVEDCNNLGGEDWEELSDED